MTDEPAGTPPPEDAEEEVIDVSSMSEEELRAAYEAEIARVRVEDVIVRALVSLLNLAARRAGLTGADEAPDFAQVGEAIEASRALLPFAEKSLAPEELKDVRDALSQLQMAFARSGAAPAAGAGAAAEEGKPGGGPAQSSGRLWVPGQ